MDLAFNGNQIIYYHMHVQWSTDLAQTYFTSPDYFAVQCWIHAAFLSPHRVNHTEAHVYHYTKFFEGAVNYMPLGLPCTRLVAVISFANVAQPYVLTAYLALLSGFPLCLENLGK